MMLYFKNLQAMTLELETQIEGSSNAENLIELTLVDLTFRKNTTEISLCLQNSSSYISIDLNKEKALHLLNFLKASLPYMTDF